MQTTALVVGPDEAPGAVIKNLARQIGFVPVLNYRGVADFERRMLTVPLAFVLCPPVDRMERLKPVVMELRTSEEERVRYAPLIYFSEVPSLDTIRAGIAMGFDDIITMPFALKSVRERLAHQLNRPLTYYATDTYFGPDRRGRLPEGDTHEKRGTGGTHHRIEIMRTLKGIQVMHDDLQVVI